MDREVITRRRLPHWYVPGAAHFITYRLIGTLPEHVIERLCARREQLLRQKPAAGVRVGEHRARAHKLLFADYEDWLDNHREIDWLADPRVAAIVRSNLYHHHNNKYHLMAYCVMPNHVHVLLQPIAEALTKPHGKDTSHVSHDKELDQPVGEQEDRLSPLTKIMHSLKSYTAHEANKVLRRTGSFWQRESYDHWVRDDEELERIVDYIRGNPVAAGLKDRHKDWFFCSCHDRYLTDGDASGWLKW